MKALEGPMNVLNS